MNTALVEHYHLKRDLHLTNIYVHIYVYILHSQYGSVPESDTIAVLLAGVLHEK